MDKKMLADYHVHTNFSDDSIYRMEDVIIDAIQLGMNEICFTDHVDYGIKRDDNDPRGIEYRSGGPGEPEQMEMANVDYYMYEATIRELRYSYEDQLSIKMGLEFGMQTHTIPQYEALYAKYPFDFIILSVHQVEDKELWTQEFQRGRTQKEYNERYYKEILDLVQQYHNYSVLGHLDLINRYDNAGNYPFEEIRPLVTEILKTVITEGKGIEVNTSSYRYGLPDLIPSRNIIRLYQALGGSIITIGSDSHKKEHLGFHIQETKQELRMLGFTQFCTFDKMKPIYHEL